MERKCDNCKVKVISYTYISNAVICDKCDKGNNKFVRMLKK